MSEAIMPGNPQPPGNRRTGEPESSGHRSSGGEQPYLQVGALIAGRYRIIRFVAEGGMGEVYEAEDSDLHEQVALKLVRPDIARDPGGVERFKREVQLARRVTHPNICRIFDVGHHRATDPRTGLPIDIPFLSMEMLRGETLATRLDRQGRLNENEALPIIAQLASALDAAHRVGVVHRDFKTGNVMLVPDPGRAVEEARKAYELSAGLSREDRLMVEGRYRETMREWGTAVDI